MTYLPLGVEGEIMIDIEKKKIYNLSFLLTYGSIVFA